MIEDALAKAFSRRDEERTFIDKLLGKEDIATLRALMKKDNLERGEILEMLYMLTSAESKLLMLTEWDRYVLMKYFVWVREFVKVTENYFDYKEDLEKKGYNLTSRTRKVLLDSGKMLEHQLKFLVDLFLMIARTSLSKNGAAFGELLKQRFEIQYSDSRSDAQPQNQTTLRG